MATEFFPILPPAQTLETLDNWGNLDSLPLSLDSTAWATAGIYGITITDGAKASEGMEGSRQSIIPLAAASASTREGFSGYSIRGLQATATAQTGQASAFIRTRLDSGEITAQAVGKLDFVRLLHLVESEPGKSGERFTAYRVRPHGAALSAKSDQSIAALRIRRDILAETAQTTEEVGGLRIRTETAKETATATASASFGRLRSSAIADSVSAIAKVEAFQFIRGLSLYGLSNAVGFANGVGVLELRGGLLAAAGGNVALSVSYALSGSGAGVAGGLATPSIVLGLSASDGAQSGERAVLSFKGWGWDKENSPSAPEWEPEAVAPEDWTQIQRNAAEWAAQGVAAQGWTRIYGGAAQWR